MYHSAQFYQCCTGHVTLPPEVPALGADSAGQKTPLPPPPNIPTCHEVAGQKHVLDQVVGHQLRTIHNGIAGYIWGGSCTERKTSHTDLSVSFWAPGMGSPYVGRWVY